MEVGRIQNFGSWSPYMVKEGRTCLGLEYFVFEGDAVWDDGRRRTSSLGHRELAILGLVEPAQWRPATWCACPRPTRTTTTPTRPTSTPSRWLAASAPNVHPVGRNGMHKYNNQDHSMYTAMLTVENMYGAPHDIWSVNVEEEYHESGPGSGPGSGSSSGGGGGSGRDAPLLPARTPATPTAP